MASWLHQSQTALFQMGPAQGEEGATDLQARACFATSTAVHVCLSARSQQDSGAYTTADC